MKILPNLDVVKKVDTDKPFGYTIQNETATQPGTPIVVDYFQDLLSNFYRLLELAKITPTDAYDGDSTQYQLVEALKKLPNLLNDAEQTLNLTSTMWSVGFDLSILPNKYFFFARASQDYVQGVTYRFKGSGATDYSFASNGFKSGDELLVIIDTSGVRAYSISGVGQADDFIFPIVDAPIFFNDTNKMWYQVGGKLLSDEPSINDLQQVIRTDLSSSTAVVEDIFVVGGCVLCFCSDTGNKYFFMQFDITDLSSVTEVTLTGTTFGTASDFSPFVFVQNGFVYVTNTMNADNKDYSITKLSHNISTATMALVSTVEISHSFVKTKNAVIKSGLLYTFTGGVLATYNLASGTQTVLGNYGTLSESGQLLGFYGSIYFRVNQTAKKWF